MDKSDFEELDKAVQSLVTNREAADEPASSVPASSTTAPNASGQSSTTSSGTPSAQPAPLASRGGEATHNARSSSPTPAGRRASVARPDISTPSRAVAPRGRSMSSDGRGEQSVASTPRTSVAGERAKVAPRARGRFMDIVPPKPKKQTPPSLSPKRSGVIITPPKAVDQPVAMASDKSDSDSPATVDKNTTESKAQNSQLQSPAPSVMNQAEMSTPPAEPVEDVQPEKEAAVVDFANELATELEGGGKPALEQVEPVSTEPELKGHSAVEDDDDDLLSLVDLEEDEESPQDSSPFIPGAQVEKRPLGSTEPVEELVDSTPSPIDSLESVDQEPATSPASESKPEPMASPVAPHAKTEAAQGKAAVKSGPSEVPKANLSGAKVTQAPAENSGPASIAPQYRSEAPDQPQADSSSMFDAEKYSQTLAHPAKKKSGWMVIVWVLLLLALGGGAAFLVYQFNLI